MKDQRKTEIKVGITVFLALIIFVWVFGWAKNLSISSNKIEIKVQFSSVAGLEVGDPVTINGVRKGYVKDISINQDKVLTLLQLDENVTLKNDSKFYITMLDLMGGKKIEIYPGSSAEVIDKNKIQNGEFVGDIASAMAMLGSVQSDLVDVIKDVKITLSNVNNILTDKEFNNNLKISLENLAEISNKLDNLLNQNSTEINKLLKNGNELTTQVNELIKTNKDSISQTLTSIKQVLNESKNLISKVNDLMDKTNKSENNLGKILNDKELMDEIKVSITQIKELTKILIEQLKDKGIEVNAHIF
ncbi:MlaD family protein [Stygiobacter electus]|uniref:MlaD family protein n=1 Tax=Stygiobacter electus TaxID=3032292 RepID=A0AAE3TDQ1_9BACT|nr:MlaD family protein [Stygiobacter electus]MDF1611448.1 MlaD family protein [Stygiobacter electus]